GVRQPPGAVTLGSQPPGPNVPVGASFLHTVCIWLAMTAPQTCQPYIYSHTVSTLELRPSRRDRHIVNRVHLCARHEHHPLTNTGGVEPPPPGLASTAGATLCVTPAKRSAGWGQQPPMNMSLGEATVVEVTYL
ncbi:MAG: hypothetical protein K2H39_03200, partial [Paramuribaculum sp.]|nr:hypothetical protein [Paramuribaculum sp.]